MFVVQFYLHTHKIQAYIVIVTVTQVFKGKRSTVTAVICPSCSQAVFNADLSQNPNLTSQFIHKSNHEFYDELLHVIALRDDFLLDSWPFPNLFLFLTVTSRICLSVGPSLITKGT